MRTFLLAHILCLGALCAFSQESIESDSISYSIELDEIVVTAFRPAMKRTATGMVLNVDRVRHLQDKSVDRILNYSPGVVVVDNEGNISINGNGGVLLVVNGNPLRLSGEQLVSYLKSIQGSDIKNIEIVTNPTSAYSAEGTGGVIIINTRRRTETGLTSFLSANYSFDRRSSYRPSAGLAYTFGKFTLYGNYSFADNRSVGERCTNDQYLTSPQCNTIIERMKDLDRSHNYRIGFDWQISPSHFIGLEYNGQTNRNSTYGTTSTQLIENKTLSETINATSSGLLQPYNNMLNLNYKWEVDSTGQLLKFVADYSGIVGMRNDIGFDNQYLDANGTVYDRIWKRSLSNEKSSLWTAQLDYEKPFAANKWKLAAGLKFSRIDIDYDYNLLSRRYGETPTDDPRFKDRFNFVENLYAAYINSAYNSRLLDANVGLRAEYTDRTSISYIKEQTNRNRDFRLFPSCFLYYKPTETSGFMAYYGMRVQRPSYALLNPFVSYITDVSYKTGNPDLKPMISNVIELTYVLRGKYYLSARANLTTDKIRDYSYTDGQYTVSTFSNISGSNMYYFNAYIPFDIRKWTSSILLNAGVLDTRAADRRRSAFTMDLSWNNYLQLNDNLGFQGNLSYSPPYKDVYQTFKRHIVKIDLCVDWSFGKEKWILSAGVDDLLDSMRRRTVTFNYPYLHETVTTNGVFAGRTFWATLKYNFSTTNRAHEQHKQHSNQDEINRL